MQAIPFTTGEYAAKFFLVGSRKIEFGEVSAGVDLLAAYADELLSAAVRAFMVSRPRLGGQSMNI